jgi:hypothetical protein
MITTDIPAFFHGVRVRLPLGLAVLAVFAAAVLILPSWWVVFLLAAAVWFMLPGVVVIRRLYRDTPYPAGLAWLLGGPIGYIMSSLLVLGARFLGFRGIWAVILCPGVALAIAWLLPSLGPGLRVPRFGRRDTAAVALLLILAAAVVAPSFRHVGADLPEGRAYRAYFTADFVWSMAVVGELSKNETMPENPFLAGEAMHYYWPGYLLPSLEHRSLGRQIRLDRMLLVNHLVLGVMFMAFFYGMTRHITASRAAAAIGCMFGVLFTSLEGLYFVIRLATHGQPLNLARNINVDALSRWYLKSLPVDGLQRMLFYQPQHQLGYALGFLCLLVIVHQWRRPRIAAAAFAGALLAGGFLVSPVSALLLGTVTVVVGGVSIVRHRAWRVGFWSVAAAAVPLGIALALSFLLHYTSQGAALLKIGSNPLARQNSLLGLAVSFGPIFIAALPGAWLLCKHARRERVILPAAVIAISLLFYFFVDVRDHKFVYVGWRAGHIIFIVLAGVVGVGVHLLVLRRQGSKPDRKDRIRRIAWAAYFIFAALIAVPTTAIDLYNTQDIYNRARFKKAQWTLVLSQDELKALDWLRRSTPPDALVQVEPFCRDPGTWAYLPAFAERRMAAGIPLSMVPLAPYMKASEQVREIYLSTNPDFIENRARQLGIDYLVVGINERRTYPQVEKILDSRPNAFPRVLKNSALSIYALSRRAKALIKWSHSSQGGGGVW